MSLSEYRSPILKKPKFGWQRYQFGNKSAAALKLSLWDSNLSEEFVFWNVAPLAGSVTAKVTLNLKIKSKVTGLSNLKNFVTVVTISPYSTQAQLASEINKALPYLGQFIYHDSFNGGSEGIQLIIDKTYLNNGPLDEFIAYSAFSIVLS
jgi:hypothetical protein